MILDRNIMDLEAPEELLETKVLATMMDGVFRHRDGIQPFLPMDFGGRALPERRRSHGAGGLRAGPEFLGRASMSQGVHRIGDV